MFEVGKKYKSKCGEGHKVVEVLAATEKYAIIKALIWTTHLDFVGVERAWEQNVFYNWEEYKEPRTITRWINVYEYNGELNMGTPWINREKAIYTSVNLVGYKDTIPITYTEPH